MTVSMQPCPDDGFLIVGAYSPYIPEGWGLHVELGQDEHAVIVPRPIVEAAMKLVFPELSAAIRAIVVAISNSHPEVGFTYQWEIDKSRIKPEDLQAAVKYLRFFLSLQIAPERPR